MTKIWLFRVFVTILLKNCQKLVKKCHSHLKCAQIWGKQGKNSKFCKWDLIAVLNLLQIQIKKNLSSSSIITFVFYFFSHTTTNCSRLAVFLHQSKPDLRPRNFVASGKRLGGFVVIVVRELIQISVP